MKRLLAIASLLAAPLLAQTTAKVDVRVVNVDVSVIDGSGKPVTDLKRDDFEVFEDDKPEAVTNFALVDRPSARGSRARTDVELRRRVILLVDNNYLEKSDRDNALRTLDQFIDGTFDGSYEWALGMIGEQLEIVQPFTTDKKSIHSAIEKIRRSATTSFHDAMDRSILDDALFQRSGLDVPAQFESRERTSRNARALANTTRGLIEAARIFSVTPGKKLAVLLTGSMDLNTAYSNFETGKDRELQDRKTATARMIEAIVQEANAAKMSIHVIPVASRQLAAPQHDVSHHSSGSGIEGLNISASSDIRDTSSAWTIAAGTGGLYLASNSVRESLDALDSAAGSYYLLGYDPGHGEDRQYHRITVLVKRAGTRVVHRQGYLDLPAEERVERLLRLRISMLQPATDIPVTMTVSALDMEGKPAVTMLAAMPMSDVTLLPRDGRLVGRVHVYLSIFDASGRNVGFHHKIQDLSLPSKPGGPFQYRMNVRLDRGEFTLALTMRDDLSNEIGTAVQKIKL
ncbi:MAG TPA: VWA domain-containing protein [Thermoanaerobaculia bacterium]|nr:VWA domain-containing protein [Thermoanaerobaculia bacterium]